MSDLDKIREKYSLKKDPPKEKDLRKPASLTDKQEMEFLKRVKEGIKNKREPVLESGMRRFYKGGKV